MSYLLISGLVILLGLLILLLKNSRQEETRKPGSLPRPPASKKKKKANKNKCFKDSDLAKNVFLREILEKKKEFKIFSLKDYVTLTTRELTESQKELLYRELKKFPLPSGAALRLSELLRDPYVDSREVAAIAATDPVLSARLLAIVNSAYFRPRSGKKVTSIHRAILLLGFNQVRNLLFQTLLEHAINKHSLLPKEEIQRIWRHSAIVSVIAGFLAKERNLASGLALTAGLMHDIGKFFLPYFEIHDEGSCLLQEEELPPLIQEEHRYGFNHPVIGAVLCHIWNLPQEIRQTVAFHHIADVAKLSKFPAYLQHIIILVAVSDYLSRFLDEDCEEKYLYELPAEMLDFFDFPDPLELLITPKLKKEVEKMTALLEEFYR